MDKADEKLLSDIDQYGWEVINVFEEDNFPGFSYSIGLYKTHKHPEIIVVGLKRELAQTLVNNIGHDIKNGKVYKSGEFYDGILDNFKCLMLTVSKDNYNEYVGIGLWYYQDIEFPLLQCIYPTTKGIYPWESNWPENIRDLQPILGDINDIKNK